MIVQNQNQNHIEKGIANQWKGEWIIKKGLGNWLLKRMLW